MLNSARVIQFVLNKSLLTNVIAVMLVMLSYCLMGVPSQVLGNIGFYALSCALTNWIAIMMLFDKIPFVYGSGVIPARFESFKLGLKRLVMNEFFKSAHIQKVLPSPSLTSEKVQEISNLIDYDKLYQSLIEGIFESKIGSVFFMMGGQNAIEPMREPIQKKLRVEVEAFLASKELPLILLKDESAQNFLVSIEHAIDKRLAELTPTMVKDIIQNMIRQHLGWLVVWGGIFGGIIGLIASFL